MRCLPRRQPAQDEDAGDRRPRPRAALAEPLDLWERGWG